LLHLGIVHLSTASPPYFSFSWFYQPILIPSEGHSDILIFPEAKINAFHFCNWLFLSFHSDRGSSVRKCVVVKLTYASYRIEWNRHSTVSLLTLLPLCHVMQSCGKRQAFVTVPVVCHRISVGNLPHHTGSPNKRSLIPLIWWDPNSLTVPYLVPVLISLVLCIILSSESPSLLSDLLNWSRNEFLIKPPSIRPSSICLSIGALKSLYNFALRSRTRGSKSAFMVLVTLTFASSALLSFNTQPVSAQRMAYSPADPMDSFEHEDEEDNEQTGECLYVSNKSSTETL